MKAKNAKHILKRPLALLLICALLLPTVILAQAALTTAPDETAPDVKVVSTLVDGGQYLEMGLNINSKEEKFQSAGILLSYDPTMLTPIKWGEVTGEDGAVVDTAKISLTPGTEADKAWDTAAILPSKGADVLSGKLTEAFVLNGKGYLYLSAEAAKAMALKQALPVEAGAKPEGLPAATTGGQTISYIGKAETAAEQATTVRFLVNTKTETPEGGDPITRPYNLSELAASLDLVTYDGKAEPPNLEAQTLLRYSPLAIDVTAEKIAGISYLADNANHTTAGYDKAVNLDFTWIAEGQTADSGGGGSASDFAPIVFYDWDETTILGTIVVNKKDKPEDIKTAIDAFTASLYPKDYNPEVAGSLYDASSPMTDKKGYSFGKWIDIEARSAEGNKVYTIYGDAISIEADTKKETIPEPANLDWTDFSSGKVLKAAFKTNNEMTQSNSAADRRYTVAFDSFNRHAAATSYSIKVRVQREIAGVGVQRCRDAALRITMNCDGTTINTEILISDIDDQIVEIAAPPNATTVSAAVIDIGGVSKWVNGTTIRSAPYSVSAGTTETKTGFVFEGNLAYINDQLQLAEGSLAATHYVVGGLNVSKGNVYGTTATGAVALRAQALINLKNAYDAKNQTGTAVGLTWQEMADAIKLGSLPGVSST